MIRLPWVTIPIRRLVASFLAMGFSPRNFLALGIAIVVCAAAGVGVLLAAGPAAADDPPGAELTERAKALRDEPSSKNYRRLAEFADEFRESELSAQASFALGMADLEAKRWGEARKRLDEARASFWLRDYATLYLARADAELGALESAQHRVGEFSFSGSALQEDAVALTAELWLRAADPMKAIAWLQRQPGLPQRPKLLMVLGQAQWSEGQQQAAVESLQRVYYEFPLSDEAEPANALLARWRKEMKGEYPPPSEELLRARAEKLWSAQAYRGARTAYLDLSERVAEPLRTEAKVRAALALYRQWSVSRACDELAQIRRVPPTVEAEFRSHRARCALHEDREKQAEADLGALEKDFPTTEWCAQALGDAARHAVERGDIQQARDYYRRLVAVAPQSSIAAEVNWKLSWLLYREHNAAEAARLLEEHLVRYPDSLYLPRALYWRAKLAADAGQKALANYLLGQLRRLAPRDYLAQQGERLQARLGAANGSAEGDNALPSWVKQMALPNDRRQAGPLPPAVRHRLDKSALLERLGLEELAERELDAALKEADHPEVHLARARVAMEEQQYAVATQRLHQAFPGYWRYRLEDLPREAWEIMFPRPYWALIQREAKRNGLDPFLVAALIRQESRFEVDAVSSAGALGLMQLMPGTARYLARSRRLSTQRILEPEVNVRLGTRYLAQLLQRFEGNLEQAVAGYNAGGTRVAEWATENGATEMPEFVESIPVTQTREFVYIVLRNQRFYHDLYGQP
jgi:soluble lytic murein transglycosylase